MATRSRPKNFPREHPTKRDQLKDEEGPSKPHPGYPGFGPPPPGKDYKGVTARTPSGTEKYYPQWSGSNAKNNKVFAVHLSMHDLVTVKNEDHPIKNG